MRNIFKALSVCTIVSGTALSGLYATQNNPILNGNNNGQQPTIQPLPNFNNNGQPTIQPLNNTMNNPFINGQTTNNQNINQIYGSNNNNGFPASNEDGYQNLNESFNLYNNNTDIVINDEKNKVVTISAYTDNKFGDIADGLIEDDESSTVEKDGNDESSSDSESSSESEKTLDENDYKDSQIKKMTQDEYEQRADKELEPLLKLYKEDKRNGVKNGVLKAVEDMIYTDHQIFYQGAVVDMNDQTWEFFKEKENHKLGGDADEDICEAELQAIGVQARQLIQKLAADKEKKKLEKQAEEQRIAKEKEERRIARESKKRENADKKKKVDDEIKAKKGVSNVIKNMISGVAPVSQPTVSSIRSRLVNGKQNQSVQTQPVAQPGSIRSRLAKK